MKLVFSLCITLLIYAQVVFAQSKDELKAWLQHNNAALSLRVNQYDYERYNRLIFSTATDQIDGTIETPDASFSLSTRIEAQGDEYYQVAVKFLCTEGALAQASVSVDLDFDNWSTENYVLMPGVVYDGNRPFRVFKSPGWYPFITDPRYIGPDVEPFVSDIPRLDPRLNANGRNGVPFIQMRSGHMTTPAIGFQSKATQKGFLLLTEQGSPYGDHGIDIEEFRSGKKARITLTAPVVRQVYQYHFMNNRTGSRDRAVDLKQGDEITIRFRIYFFAAPTIQSLFDAYADHCKALPADRSLSYTYPFSNTFEILEQKFNKYQWVEDPGFYKFRIGYQYDFQVGWMGGAIFTYPLLLHGDQTSKDRVIKMMDWFFGDYISPSGYFWDSSKDGTEFGGIYPGIPIGDTVTLVRCNGDGLYFSFKHLEAMKHLNIPIKSQWESGAKGVANAFIDTWNRFGQLGQYIGLKSGDVVVGNSASGAIVPAGLVLASRYFGDESFLEKAKAMGEHYYQHYTKRGITYGGPGDALNGPDSESAYALVESFTLLYEATGEQKWLTYAEESARQFSTWVLSYNFKFPENSTYGKLGKKPMGAVFANPQNGTGTPGICTYSGISLLNLTRYTNNPFYANLLKDIAHNMPQYLSHPEQMINPEHVGWMSERVVTADWLEDIGEIALHSTWPEAALALTYTEIPGVYIDLAGEQLIAFDNIKGRLLKANSSKVKVELENPTSQVARVKVFLDRETDGDHVVSAFSDFIMVELQAQEKKILNLK